MTNKAQPLAATLEKHDLDLFLHRVYPGAFRDKHDEDGYINFEANEFSTAINQLYKHTQTLKEKARTNEKYSLAAKTASELHSKLGVLKYKYFHYEKTKERYDSFKAEALSAIESAKPILSKHRGFKQIIGNIILAILGLGVVYGAACLLNKAITGNFLFFKTTSLKKIEKVESVVKSISRP